jgi:hypothetical protein
VAARRARRPIPCIEAHGGGLPRDRRCQRPGVGQEFVVVGWTDPEGWRPHLSALLLGYYNLSLRFRRL